MTRAALISALTAALMGCSVQETYDFRWQTSQGTVEIVRGSIRRDYGAEVIRSLDDEDE